MGSIREFVRQEIIRQKTKASASLMLLGDLLANNDIQLIMQEAAQFLEELKPLHVLLDLYSDPKCVPLACGVWDSLEKIRVWAESKAITIPKAKEAYDKHMARVKERHNMLFWECVRWLNPNVIEYRYDEEIPSLDKMNRAFHPEVIPKDEWDKYTQITSFNVPEGMHVGDWWAQDSVKADFPELAEIALCAVWVPPVVTACDSLTSVMGAQFRPNQGSLKPETAATMVFLRANARHLPLGLAIDEVEYDSSADEDED